MSSLKQVKYITTFKAHANGPNIVDQCWPRENVCARAL